MTYHSPLHSRHGQPSYKRELHTPEQSVVFDTVTQIRRFVDPDSFGEDWTECLEDLQMRNAGFRVLPVGVIACTYASNNDISRMFGQKDPRFGKDLDRTKELQESLGAVVRNFVAGEKPEPVKIAPYFILMGDRLALQIRNFNDIADDRRRLFKEVAKELGVDTGLISPRKPHISVMRVHDKNRAHTINQQRVFPAQTSIKPASVTQEIRVGSNTRLRGR